MSIVLQTYMKERLRSNEIAWLSTVRTDGRPHSVPVWFLWESATILIFSKLQTQKVRNLRQNPYVTLALDQVGNGQNPVIFEGTARLLEREEAGGAIQMYGEKYREGLQRIGVTVEMFTALYSQPIRVTPARLIGGQ